MFHVEFVRYFNLDRASKISLKILKRRVPLEMFAEMLIQEYIAHIQRRYF